MTLSTLFSICKAFNDLGWSIQQQLTAIASGEAMEDQNPNALRAIRDFLERDVSETDEELTAEAQELVEQINDFLNSPEGEDDDNK